MQLADSVRSGAQAQRQRGHVEGVTIAFGADGEVKHALQRHAPGVGLTSAVTEWPNNAAHQINCELLVSGRDGGVNREDGVALHMFESVLERLARGDKLARALHEVERGVPLIQVIDGRIYAECAQCTDATNAEHHLLMQAHLATTDVQDMRDRAISFAVCGDVGIKE